MKITILTPPTAEPLSLAEARAHLRIDTFDDDGALAGFILAARQHIESETGVALCTRTLLGTVDNFPAGKPLSLPVHPVQSVTAVRYYDTAGSLVTWSSAEWEADLTGNVPRIAPRNGFAWPTPAKKLGAVQVEFVAGYGGPELVPQPVMQAMRLLVGHWYENREAVNVGNMVNAYPLAVSMLLADYRAFA